MKILILGIDGYIGWSLCLHLANRGHKIAGVDNFNRRKWVKMVNSQSVIPIPNMYERKIAYRSKFGKNLDFYLFDVRNYKMLKDVLKKFKPDAIVHLAEQPSAPFSMKNFAWCLETYENNILGTLALIWAVKEVNPKIHLVKLGTMGSYGYDLGIDVPEGPLEIEHLGKKVILPFPKAPGSFYHACYDDKTEILTKNGWKIFKDLTYQDEVATLNREKRQLEFQRPLDIQKYTYSGPIYKYKSQRIDLAVTPNHRILYFPRSSFFKHLSKGNFIEASKLIQRKADIGILLFPDIWIGDDQRNFTLPLCEKWIGHPRYKKVNAKYIDMKTWLEFFGIWLSEGYTTENSRSYRVGIVTKSSSIKRWIENLLSKMQFKYTIYSSENGKYDFRIYDKQLFDYLKQFGKAHQKFIPQKIKNLSQDKLKILLFSLIKGDGRIIYSKKDSNRFWATYITTSKRLADDVQEIAIKCGYASRIVKYCRHKDKNLFGENPRDIYHVYISISQLTQLLPKKIKIEKYEGKVYCCSVPNEVILVRRNGYAYFCGNSKACDSINIELASKVYGLSISDVNQGIVYGTRIDETDTDKFLTRFDIDECFGTALNRFVSQAVSGLPITLYGKGHQKRGFIPLRDSIQCLRILIENPPKDGEYRVVNQIEDYYDLTDLAQNVKKIAKEFGINAKISNIKNPRIENEDNYYNPTHKKLLQLGYQPTSNMERELRIMFEDIIRFKNRIKKEVLIPRISWK